MAGALVGDTERCYRAVRARDVRFDGLFVLGVTTTGIYCRPSCPATTPRRRHVRFFRTAAEAQDRGFRACKRCRPDTTPGSPAWDIRADLTARAVRLIADGVVERDGVGGLARRLGYSERQLHRQLVSEVGTGALALARSYRAEAARSLIETTGLSFADVAFAAGFASVRQFNDTMRRVYAATPTQLRAAAHGTSRTVGRRNAEHAEHVDLHGQHQGRHGARGWLSLNLPVRQPFDSAALIAFLAAHAVRGVEEVADGTYRRTLRLPHGPGVVALTPRPDAVRCELWLHDLRDLQAAVRRCRRALDLDADPCAVDEHLRSDPLLAPLVGRRPGLRVPGGVDPAEVAVRAVLGQQVSLAGARAAAERLVRGHGEPLPVAHDTLTHLFPTPSALAALEPADLALPRARAVGLLALARGLAGGELVLDPGTDRAAALAALQALPGIGPWTAGYVSLRGLGDPDVFLAGDLAALRSLARLGGPADPREATARAAAWRPWRSYALQHLWTAYLEDRP